MDVVFDPVGMIVPSLKCVNFNARILVVGFAAGTIEKVSCYLPSSNEVGVDDACTKKNEVVDPCQSATFKTSQCRRCLLGRHRA